MQIKNKEKIYIFIIIILAVAFVGLFVMSISGFFFANNPPTGTSLKLGDSAVIELNSTGTKEYACNFDGAILGGQKIKQNITIKNTGEKNLFLRAKLTIFTDKNEIPQIELVTANDWIKEDDGYFYYSGNIGSLNSVGFISGIFLPENEQLKSSSNYIMVFTIESLSTEFDKTLIWGR